MYMLTAPHEQDVIQGQFLSEVLTGLDFKFSFPSTDCHTNVNKPSLPYYLDLAGRLTIGFIPFPRLLA